MSESPTTNLLIKFDCGCYYDSGVLYDCSKHGGYITRVGMATIVKQAKPEVSQE